MSFCDYPPVRSTDPRAKQSAGLAESIGKPSGFNVKRILGKGDLWITEYTEITYQGDQHTVSDMEFRNGKGRARDTVFRGFVRGAELEWAMGSADRVTPHWGGMDEGLQQTLIRTTERPRRIAFEELHFHRTQAKLDAYEEDFW